jgi:hypothetical protein
MNYMNVACSEREYERTSPLHSQIILTKRLSRYLHYAFMYSHSHKLQRSRAHIVRQVVTMLCRKVIDSVKTSTAPIYVTNLLEVLSQLQEYVDSIDYSVSVQSCLVFRL